MWTKHFLHFKSVWLCLVLLQPTWPWLAVLAMFTLLPCCPSLPSCALLGVYSTDCITRAPLHSWFLLGLASGRHLLKTWREKKRKFGIFSPFPASLLVQAPAVAISFHSNSSCLVGSLAAHLSMSREHNPSPCRHGRGRVSCHGWALGASMFLWVSPTLPLLLPQSLHQNLFVGSSQRICDSCWDTKWYNIWRLQDSVWHMVTAW